MLPPQSWIILVCYHQSPAVPWLGLSPGKGEPSLLLLLLLSAPEGWDFGGQDWHPEHLLGEVMGVSSGQSSAASSCFPNKGVKTRGFLLLPPESECVWSNTVSNHRF